MTITNDVTRNVEIASKYVGVRWKNNQFEISKSQNKKRKYRYTTDSNAIPGLIDELVNEIAVLNSSKASDISVPKVVLTRPMKASIIEHTGKKVWTLKEAQIYSIKEYEREGADYSMITRLKLCVKSIGNLLSGEKTLLSQLTFDVINELWEDELIGEGNSLSTINKKKSSIQKLCRNAVEKGHLEHMPLIKRRKEKLPAPRHLKRDLESGIDEEAELLKMFSLLGKHEHREIAEVLIDFGCRQSELWLCQEQDINMSANSVYIRTTKNGNPRHIYMSARTRAIIEKRLTGEMGNRLVFNYDNGWFRNGWDRARERLAYTRHFTTNELCKTWCEAKGLKYAGGKSVNTTRMADAGYTPHLLRHTCLTRMVREQEASLEKVQQWAGHKSIIVTRRYISIQSTALKDIAVGQNKFNSNLALAVGGTQRI
jgi:integrase